MPNTPKTIVLVHGAWLNSASWDGVQGALRSARLSRDRARLAL